MKRSTVLNLRQIGITDFLNKNKIFLLMAITFAVGCIAASFIYPENKKLQGIISDYFLNFLSHRIDKKFFNVFISSFLELAFYMLVIFLGGSSMFGVVLIPFIVLIRGLYYGGFSALLYSEFALKGVAFNALVFIPPALIFTLCIFFAAKSEEVGE